jgi:hypothetical protein
MKCWVHLWIRIIITQSWIESSSAYVIICFIFNSVVCGIWQHILEKHLKKHCSDGKYRQLFFKYFPTKTSILRKCEQTMSSAQHHNTLTSVLHHSSYPPHQRSLIHDLPGALVALEQKLYKHYVTMVTKKAKYLFVLIPVLWVVYQLCMKLRNIVLPRKCTSFKTKIWSRNLIRHVVMWK